ncbi:VPDSG-CTERM sorting domain-containing protein [Candidatus Pelagisphaera phototrophica]|nr:VPDSG-CTERM sorting domain-containing protein [Candidatus Pelagisphaera phototrophica]
MIGEHRGLWSTAALLGLGVMALAFARRRLG